MPTYVFEHPRTGESVEVVLGANDKHEFFDENGLEWNRVWTAPNVGYMTKIDPFNERQYLDKTGASKGSMGDLIDRSKELSEKRAQKVGGEDPIKRKYLDNYSKSRKGTKHLSDKKGSVSKGGITVSL